MHELTEANVLDYLRERNWLPKGPARVESLGGGVSNLVLRIETPTQSFVLKQSRPQLRTRDAWFSDLERIYREQEVMQVLRPLLPAGVVPEVLFVDRPNFVFTMTSAPLESRPWKQLLLAGHVDLTLGQRVGLYLGRLHEATARDPALMEPFRDHQVFVQLRADPFYRRVQERRPELAAQIGDITDRMLACKEALCHGDYTPKNMLIHGGGFTLVDYETACLGDPAMDLGLCLCHLLLKAVHLPGRREEFFELTRRFWQGYGSTVTYRPLAELQARGIQHLAVCLLARIDGTSPVDYLPEETKRNAVRQVARVLLQKDTSSWHDVLATMRQALERVSLQSD
jgi:5-methylthioribose kinase